MEPSIEVRLRQLRAARRRREIIDGAKQQLSSVTEKILNYFPTFTFHPEMEHPEEQKVLIRSDSKETITSVDLTSELSDESPVDPRAESWTYFILKWSIYFTIWLTMFIFFVKIEFGAVFLIVSMLVGVCLNTRTKPRKSGEKSAYSVFNKDCESINGTLTAQQFEREIMFGAGAVR